MSDPSFPYRSFAYRRPAADALRAGGRDGRNGARAAAVHRACHGYPCLWPLFHARAQRAARSEEHTSELQSLMRISYAVFCLKKKNKQSEYMVMYQLKDQRKSE